VEQADLIKQNIAVIATGVAVKRLLKSSKDLLGQKLQGAEAVEMMKDEG
jgi:hypothetical protein